MKNIIIVLICIVISGSLITTQSLTAKTTGIERELQKIRYLLTFGQKNADSYTEKCETATSEEYIAGLQATWNAGNINRLQCLNAKIEGTFVLGSEIQTFSNGMLRKYQYMTDWGVKVDLWFYNGQKEVIGIFSDQNNYLKFRIPDINDTQLIIEEAIIPTLDRISIYRKYFYPEIWIERYYVERYSPQGWYLSEFTDLMFNSRQGRIDFIAYLKEQAKSR